jgi:DNA helicase HerA-like ATPase
MYPSCSPPPSDLQQVYARPNAPTAAIGLLHQNPEVPAYILADELFGKHFSIVGTTGSGKSCLVATLLSAIIDILAQLFRIPVAGKPITILDLAGIPSEVVNVIVSVLCRLAFDFALWSETPIPITIVCEEAHRYAPRDQSLGFEAAKQALFRIAKEGRKYAVSLCVVSQRPSDLAPGLLSECNTLFALRMTGQEDQDIVRSAVPESCYGLLNFLPALGNGEAIAVGEGVSLPMRISLSALPAERRPRSATASFTEAWTSEVDGGRVEKTVERWRQGLRADRV